jgi:hypothetical protein
VAKIEHKDIGDRLQPQFSWTIGGVGTDPSQIVVRQQDPAGVETVVTTASSPATLTSASTPLARMSAGVFKLSPGVSATSSGYWFFRAEGTGGAEAAEEYQYTVDPSEFTSNAGLSDRALVGLAETKDWLQKQNIDTGEDLDLVRVINDISQRMHDEAEREFKPITAGSSSRMFYVEDYCNTVSVGDMSVLSTSSPMTIFASDQTTSIKTFASTDLITLPQIRQAWQPIRKIKIKPTSYLYLVPGQWVQVTGTWGFPQVPGNLRQAVLDAVAYTIDRDVEHYREDITAAPGGGGDVTLMLSLPPSALEIASWYSDPWLG